MLGKLDIQKQKNEIRSLSYTICKINSKWIKDLNVRPEATKLLEENIGEKLPNIGLGNDFWMTPRAQGNKGKNKVGLHQTKKLCTAKETINKMKWQPTGWEKIFPNHISDKGLTSKLYKEKGTHTTQLQKKKKNSIWK